MIDHEKFFIGLGQSFAEVCDDYYEILMRDDADPELVKVAETVVLGLARNTGHFRESIKTSLASYREKMVELLAMIPESDGEKDE